MRIHNMNNKIIVILGQTSTGKSDFAVEIAKKIDGEIISADSRQVYKGMDLGTGKITKKEMSGIPHYLLDIISPKKTFSVNSYQKLALEKIDEILNKGKVPILCGGTGFYIDSIVNGIVFPEVPPDTKLRKELSKYNTLELFEILKKLDKDRAKNIDKNNSVRLIRAIEIAKTLGSVPKLKINICTNSDMADSIPISNFNFLKIGLKIPDDTLKERIYLRIINRIKRGMIKEIENLHEKGLSWKKMYNFGLEYRYISLYLQNKIKKDEMINKLNTETWHYAKRQNTWFKRDPNTIWINPLENSDKNKILKKIVEFTK